MRKTNNFQTEMKIHLICKIYVYWIFHMFRGMVFLEMGLSSGGGDEMPGKSTCCWLDMMLMKIIPIQRPKYKCLSSPQPQPLSQTNPAMSLHAIQPPLQPQNERIYTKSSSQTIHILELEAASLTIIIAIATPKRIYKQHYGYICT